MSEELYTVIIRIFYEAVVLQHNVFQEVIYFYLSFGRACNVRSDLSPLFTLLEYTNCQPDPQSVTGLMHWCVGHCWLGRICCVCVCTVTISYKYKSVAHM